MHIIQERIGKCYSSVKNWKSGNKKYNSEPKFHAYFRNIGKSEKMKTEFKINCYHGFIKNWWQESRLWCVCWFHDVLIPCRKPPGTKLLTFCRNVWIRRIRLIIWRGSHIRRYLLWKRTLQISWLICMKMEHYRELRMICDVSCKGHSWWNRYAEMKWFILNYWSFIPERIFQLSCTIQ